MLKTIAKDLPQEHETALGLVLFSAVSRFVLILVLKRDCFYTHWCMVNIQALYWTRLLRKIQTALAAQVALIADSLLIKMHWTG